MGTDAGFSQASTNHTLHRPCSSRRLCSWACLQTNSQRGCTMLSSLNVVRYASHFSVRLFNVKMVQYANHASQAMLMMSFVQLAYSWTPSQCAVQHEIGTTRKSHIAQAMLMMFVFMGLFAGYFSARLYKSFRGEEWKKTTMRTALLFPGTCVCVCVCVKRCIHACV
jgi:glutamine amidotransferase-like uncharacterized protein